MNVVGIDVSKGKSVVAVMRPFGEVVISPFEVYHSREGLEKLVERIKSLDGETKAVMEYTSKYYRPIANFLREQGVFVCVANALLLHHYCNNSIRRAKTDKIDSVKIANYGIENWLTLPEYTPEEETRELLKTYNRQFENYIKMEVALQNNLISLLDQTFPGIKQQFWHSGRLDGHEKWVDFAKKFWHSKCVSKMAAEKFTESYNKWCRDKGYRASDAKAEEIFLLAQTCVSTLPASDDVKLLIQTAVNQLNTLLESSTEMAVKMNDLAKKLAEYEVIHSFYGVGDRLGPRLLAEIGDVRRFYKKGALVAYAGLDAPPYQSGGYNAANRHISKRGSPLLRKALFELMRVLLIKKPEDNAIYDFMQKKRLEGKPYKVYVMAGASKFLRIYYGKTAEFFAEASDA